MAFLGVLWLKIYWVVRKVEDEFGIKRSDEESIDTVGDLYRAKPASMREHVAILVDEVDVCVQLNVLLVHHLALEPKQVVRAARYDMDLKL